MERLRQLLRDRRAWAVAGLGGALGVGVALYRRRSGSSSAAGATSTAPYASMSPSVYDSSLQDIWEGFNQVALDQQRQISELQDQLGRPTPPTPSTPPPRTSPRAGAPRARYELTGRYLGRGAGHPVSYDYLQRLGVIKRAGGKWVLARSLGSSPHVAAGHPVSYSYLQRIGFVRPA